jgi:hypothetical protein
MIAVIVETRINKALPDIILDHYKYLPDDCDLLFFTSEEGFKYYDNELENTVFVDTQPIKSLNDYNKLLTSHDFWAGLPNEKALIFQHDSMLLRDGIEEFLEFDLVGSPWRFQQHGGNGGLTIRNPLVMREICKDFKWNPSLGYEDVYFSNVMYNNDIGELAPREVCERFSCETIFKLGTLGYHAIDKYLPSNQCHLIRTQYDG